MVDFKKERVNEYDVKLLIKKKDVEDSRPYKYEDVFNTCFVNMMLVAKKNSGKSVLITNLIKIMANKKDTIVRIFSDTILNDLTFLQFVREFNKEGGHIEIYQNPDVVKPQLKEIDEFFKNKHKSEKYFEKKMKFPLIIYIFDDFRDELLNGRNNLISSISSRNRHRRTVLIYSSQKYKDMAPIVRQNANVICLFRGMNHDNLDMIYKEIINTANMSFEEFQKIYEDATSEQYNFLYIDHDVQEFRKNLNEKYILSNLKKNDILKNAEKNEGNGNKKDSN